MVSVIDKIELMTPITSNLVKDIVSKMKGNTFHHHFHILYALRTLINKEMAIYTEIGTFNGGSLCLMLQHTSPVKCVSIDPFHLDRTNSHIVMTNIDMFNIYKYDVELTKKFSTDNTLITDLKSRNFTTDILFIDGDHSYSAVIHDFTVFSEFVSIGGFIVFDDYHDKQYSPQVKPAVDHIVKTILDKKLPYEIIGSPKNFNSVYPENLKYLNEFILRKI